MRSLRSLTICATLSLLLFGGIIGFFLLVGSVKNITYQDGYLAGVRAQADNVCHVLWSPEYQATLGSDGFIENCVMRGMD